MKQFQLLTKVLGYYTKADETNVSPDVLVSPSQNVLINDEEQIETRDGYTLYGASSSDHYPIESSKDWETSAGTVISLRSLNDQLQFYDTNAGAWTDLSDGFSAVDFCFTTWWNTTEGIDLLLFVNGGDKIWDWSGAITTLKSATANTITKKGTNTWAQDRFLTAGTREVIIDGTTYAYTGGETTDTLTGVTPSPAGESADSTIFQAIRLNDNQPANNSVNDSISVLNNQVYVGSLKSREVYVSSNTSFTDYTFSSPRVPGEGALLVLDNITRGFARLGKYMLISSGRDDWYRTDFVQLEISTTLVETLSVKKLKTGSEWAAQSQDLITEVGDTIAFISFEPALRIIESVEELENPQMPIVSDPIKPDFDNEDFANGHIKFHKNRLYICSPTNDKVYINETKQATDRDGRAYLRRFWQPPQVLPIRKFAIIGGKIYGHSGRVAETYKLFDGLNDNAKAFTPKAAFSYRSYGKREALKNFDEWMTEGYIASNTELTLELKFDFDGFTQTLESTIDGSDDSILFQPSGGGSLGDSPIGDAPIGDQEEEEEQNPKFRIINTYVKEDFFEIQAVYSSNEIDYKWSLLSHGGNIQLSTAQPVNIKQ